MYSQSSMVVGNATSTMPSGNQFTMSSRDLLEMINKVRLEENENAVRVNQFHERVADELSDFNYKTFVVENLNNTKSTYFELTQDMCMLVAMRESKKVRRIVLEQLKTKFYHRQIVIPQTLPDALRLAAELAEEKLKLEYKVQQDAPKVAYADKVSLSQNGESISNYAKSIKVGPIKLFNYLRKKKYLNSEGRRHNTPRQSYIDQGYFTLKEIHYESKNGEVRTAYTTLITGKGRVWLTNKLINDGFIS